MNRIETTHIYRRMAAFSVIIFLTCSFQVSYAATHVPSSQDWQKGASIYSVNKDDFASDMFHQSLKDLKATGATYVSLVIPYHQATKDSSTIYAGNDTPSDDVLTSAITYAHSLGLKVMLKPHLAPDDTDWRAYINATDRATWFKSYGTTLDHLGDIAEKTKAEEICMGTELISMTSTTTNPTNTHGWIGMIQDLRSHYSGLLTYSANWGGNDFTDEVDHVEFWPYLDYIGISAYYPLANDVWNPSVTDIMNSWKTWDQNNIAPLYNKYHKKILFTEVGYRSVDAANTDPWDGGIEAGMNLDIQTRLYDALMRYWNNKPYFEGFQMWNWELDPNDGGIANTHYTVQHKPAEQLLKLWFANKKTTAIPLSFVTTIINNSSTTKLSTNATDIRIGLETLTYPPVDSVIRGDQVFKAAVVDVPIDTYVMYWQVDGGKPIEMHDSSEGFPHKEALIDTSGWTWRGKGPYMLNFISREFSGKIIAQESIPIYISH